MTPVGPSGMDHVGGGCGAAELGRAREPVARSSRRAATALKVRWVAERALPAAWPAVAIVEVVVGLGGGEAQAQAQGGVLRACV